MAALIGERVGIKETGSDVIVPESPTAKLMYYLDCVALVINPFAPEPPVTARADPGPFYPL